MRSVWMTKMFGDEVDPPVRLQELFGGRLSSSGQPPKLAPLCTREAPQCAGYEACGNASVTIRCLREADRKSTSRSATVPVCHVTMREA